MNETIAAIATAQGGALSVIRVSGEEAITCVNRIFSKDLLNAPGYSLHYGEIREGDEPVDEVLVSVFRAPRSYTGENMVEISGHGGVFVTRKVLSLVLGAGARMARRGEFTERAFLNGKMDLSQAESVNDLVKAGDEVNAKSAVHGLKGSVKKLLEPLVDSLSQIVAMIEVNIDYPEYDDVHQLTEEEILPACEKWQKQIHEIIETAEKAHIAREGIKTVILGRPNVGKSSLLNAMLEEDKAIVTDIAGTTRDLVEGTVRIGGITLNLIDTAGIRESEDKVEKIGIQRSIDAMNEAQLVILVLEAGKELNEEDQKLLEMTEGRQRIIVYNKNDQAEMKDVLSISAINNDIAPLVEAIRAKYENELFAAESDTLNNERQTGLAIQAQSAMKDAISALKAGMELDLVTLDLQRSWEALREITGKAGRENLLDEIFSRFCLGK